METRSAKPGMAVPMREKECETAAARQEQRLLGGAEFSEISFYSIRGCFHQVDGAGAILNHL